MTETSPADTAAYAAYLAGLAARPPAVTMTQAQLALYMRGKLGDVNAAVAAAGGTVAIYWQTAQTVERDHPIVAALGAAIGLSSADIDALFVDAAAL